MEEPLLVKSRKKPNALFSSALFQCAEEAPVKSPEIAPIVSPSSSSVLKERLIYGSPDMHPGSHFVWQEDYALPSDRSNNEADKRGLLEDSGDLRTRFPSMPLSWKFADSREKAEKIAVGEDVGRQSHGVPISLQPSIGKTDAESWTGKKKRLHRSNTVPTSTVIDDNVWPHALHKSIPSPLSAVTRFCIGLVLYLIIGVAIFTWQDDHFSGTPTQTFVDALYFCIVTMCTIGYGDITPTSPFAKLFSCIFVLVGFGFIVIFLSGMVNYALDSQEALCFNASYLVNTKKGRMQIRSKVALAFGVVITCLVGGTFVIHFLEKVGWLDSFYLACMSITTVGYGDHAFKTISGRLFASLWLLVSMLAFVSSLIYLAEAQIDKRRRLRAKLALEKDLTIGDLIAADSDNDGCMSKSEFVVYKLKLMGKVEDEDIAEVCKQFDRLDSNNCGKIHMSNLLDSYHH